MKQQLVWLTAAVVGGIITERAPAELLLDLGPGQFVQAGGSDIDLAGWSVPSYAHWDGDDRPDLIVGHEDAAVGKVSVYLNMGTATAPVFESPLLVQSAGADLWVPDEGCMDAFPRVVYWDEDPRKDLLMGLADGTVRIYLNTLSDAAPSFDVGTNLLVGPVGEKSDIDVGWRATSVVTDWNSDGRKDLVVGALDGRIRIFVNEGTNTAPDFVSDSYATADGSALTVPSGRASPVVLDLNGDGKKDILTGNTNGQLLFYPNVGTDAAPSFSSYQYVQASGVNIDLPSTPRSRPSVTDWNADGRWDVLIGDGTGKVHLFLGVSEPLLADFDGDGDVDGHDFLAWQVGFGMQAGAQKSDGDYDNDGDVEGDDFLGWRSDFGSGTGAASAAVPEPTSIVLGLIMAALGFLSRRGGIGQLLR